MGKVKVAGADEAGKTKKMAVVANWRWEQGANAHDHSFSGKSADEAIAGGRGMGQDSDVVVSGMGLFWAENDLEIQLRTT